MMDERSHHRALEGAKKKATGAHTYRNDTQDKSVKPSQVAWEEGAAGDAVDAKKDKQDSTSARKEEGTEPVQTVKVLLTLELMRKRRRWIVVNFWQSSLGSQSRGKFGCYVERFH